MQFFKLVIFIRIDQHWSRREKYTIRNIQNREDLNIRFDTFDFELR